MTPKIFAFSALILLLAFYAGRRSAPEKIKIETKIVIKTEVLKDEHKAVSTAESVTEVTRPDGTKIKRTNTRTAENLDTRIVERIIKAEAEKTEIETRKGLIVSLTAHKQLNDLFAPPVLGASVLFPIVFGLYGGASIQLNSSVGISLGWAF